eukprot:snap_masked-scaffold_7-processed-gene-3.46-mRNA-1 protein AED:1.00 eAED:1.00 QI:0/0/0/0/1/1/3/0/151
MIRDANILDENNILDAKVKSHHKVLKEVRVVILVFCVYWGSCYASALFSTVVLTLWKYLMPLNNTIGQIVSIAVVYKYQKGRKRKQKKSSETSSKIVSGRYKEFRSAPQLMNNESEQVMEDKKDSVCFNLMLKQTSFKKLFRFLLAGIIFE